MTELSFLIGIEYIHNISLLVTLCINHFSTDCERNTKSSSKNKVCNISWTYLMRWKHWIKNHTGCRCGSIYEEADVIIGLMTRASFVLWLSFYICIIFYFCRLTLSVWFYQLVLLFLKHFLKFYLVALYCDGWNMMRFWLLFAASLKNWPA